jgi:pimeloyl-ACP methyl ester carboxylesterase
MACDQIATRSNGGRFGATFQSRRPPLRRTAAEAGALILPAPRLPVDSLAREVPKGDGHAILVLPGMLRGDAYTADVCQFLTAIGYTAWSWNLGTNIGPTKWLLDGASKRLIELSDAYGPVSLLGFSMGGLFARYLASRMPDRVRQVITVCSPIHEPARNFWLPLQPLLGFWPSVDLAALAREIARPLPVPGTFLFSRADGLVNYAACLDAAAPAADNIEISGPHVLVARNPDVMTIVARRLARAL